MALPLSLLGNNSRIDTVGRVLIACFSDCVLGKLGQIANPIIAMVDPVPYYSIHPCLCLQMYTNCEHRKNSQFAIIENQNHPTVSVNSTYVYIPSQSSCYLIFFHPVFLAHLLPEFALLLVLLPYCPYA